MSSFLNNDFSGLISYHEFNDLFLSENCWQAKIAQRLFLISKKSKKVCRSRCVAAVLRKRKVIAIGKNSLNSTKLARRFKKNDDAIFEHAEIAAIKKGIKTGQYFDTIFVVRTICRDGVWIFAPSKPCKGCVAAIKHFNIKNVFYSSFSNSSMSHDLPKAIIECQKLN